MEVINSIKSSEEQLKAIFGKRWNEVHEKPKTP